MDLEDQQCDGDGEHPIAERLQPPRLHGGNSTARPATPPRLFGPERADRAEVRCKSRVYARFRTYLLAETTVLLFRSTMSCPTTWLGRGRPSQAKSGVPMESVND